MAASARNGEGLEELKAALRDSALASPERSADAVARLPVDRSFTMRGFGAVQACYAYESQMDRLAEACGLSPVEVRVRNAVSQGSSLITGQVIDSPAPLADMLRDLAEKGVLRPL